jgi:hypothetical protein
MEMSWGDLACRVRFAAPSAAITEGSVVFAILGVAAIALLAMWAMRAFASPWSGLGDDVESFEDPLSFLRFVSLPVLVVSLALLFLLLDWSFWPEAGNDPCSKPSANAVLVPGMALIQTIDASTTKLTGDPIWAEVLSRLKIVDRTLPEIPAISPVEPSPAIAGQIGQLTDAVASLGTAIRSRLESSDAIAQAISDAAKKLAEAPVSPDLVTQLKTIEGRLRTIGDTAENSPKAIQPDLLARLDAIEKAIEGWPPGPSLDAIKRAVAEATAKLASVSPPTDLMNRLDVIQSHLNTIAANMSRRNGPSQSLDGLDAIAAKLSSIETRLNTIGAASALMPVLDHLTTIETLLGGFAHQSPRLCRKLPPFNALASAPNEIERRLLGAAERRGLTPTGQYRVTERQLFYNPGDVELSTIGKRVLNLIVEQAHRDGFAIAIRAEADAVGDGDRSDLIGRERLDNVAAFIAEHSATPVVGIGVTPSAGSASDQYRRIVRIDVLEPCS